MKRAKSGKMAPSTFFSSKVNPNGASVGNFMQNVSNLGKAFATTKGKKRRGKKIINK